MDIDLGTGGAGTGTGGPPGSRKVAAAPKRTWLYVVIGVAAVAVLALILVFLPKEVSVPNVVGLSQADATTAAEKENLVLTVAGIEYTTALPEGAVASQYPDPGALVPKSDPLYVMLASQKPKVQVPDVTGQKLGAAVDSLRKAGLDLAPVKLTASEKDLGTVLAQDPQAGATVDAGIGVTLTVSKGPAPAPAPVPNLVGMDQQTAVSIIEALGFKASVQQIDSSEPKGTVVSQDPKPGTVLDPGSTVTINVSKSSQTSTTPAPTTTTVAPTTTTVAATTTLPPTTEPPTTEPPTTEPPATTDTTEALPSNILYEADWSSGMNGWSGTSGWTTTGGMLVNNGEGEVGSGSPAMITAPYQPDTPDYIIVSVIALTGTTKPVAGPVKAFGEAARVTSAGGYTMGCGPSPVSGSDNLFLANPAKGEQLTDTILDGAPFDPGTGWHTYRLEVSGSTISVSVDSILEIKVTDSRWTDPGKLGLWAAGTPISVKSFKVYRAQ